MSKASKRREALVYHAKPTPGKIEIVPTKRYATQRDLSLAYSPGVAEPCLEIAKDKSKVYNYTSKGNMVAIISNGTAVLGLGNIGAEAGKPVMEGKALLFKIFSDIDGIDIELDTEDVEKFIQTVKIIAPTFGGINLEDIKSPEAFEIERRLKEELDIPVMHDDQHGTAIISAAAFLNAIEITNRNISKTKIVISGAGAAAISCARLYKSFGVKKQNMIMLDSRGVIRKDREILSAEKLEFATDRKIDTLDEAMKGADAFIGLSIANIVSADMLKSMAKNPIVFAMANPDPEVSYNLAISTRKDIIMATGRSDLPNQVNNVLGFPFIFRGALDVRATTINEEMKIAAVKAIAKLAKETVPEQVNIAYNKVSLSFGREYIIPKPFDPRLITEIPPEVAKAAMETGVAREPIDNMEKYKEGLAERMGNDNKTIRLLYNRAKSAPKRIVYTEADQIDIVKAAQISYEEGFCIPILLGSKERVEKIKQEIGFDANIEIIDPKSKENKTLVNNYSESFWQSRKRSGITLYEAKRRMTQRNYFGAMMVKDGDADGFITGYTRSYVSALEPVLGVIDKERGVKKVASINLMLTSKGPLFLSDTAINISPNTEDLVSITSMTSRVVKLFGLDPVIAMLSYSNFGSSKHPDSKKIKAAVDILHKKYPNMIVDGEIQFDFAINKELLKNNFKFSKLVNKKVNTCIFPNLESANITYKMLKELNDVETVGPILMGLKKPVYILQLGASVDEIVNMTAVAVVHAQQKTM